MRTSALILCIFTTQAAYANDGMIAIITGLSWAILIIAPICIGLLFGGIQWVYYRLRILGGMKQEDVPPFPLLFFRGMLVNLAIIAGMTFFSAGQTTADNPDPLYPSDVREDMMEAEAQRKSLSPITNEE